MGKSGKGLGIFALMIAIGALGLSAYQFILPSPSEGASNVRNVWYDEQTSTFFPITSGYGAIPGLYIMATVNSGESLYVLFNTFAFINNPSTGFFISFKIYIDENVIDEPKAEIAPDYTLTTAQSFSVTLQISINNLSAGTYNITCRAYSGGSSNRLFDSSLYVQTYI